MCGTRNLFKRSGNRRGRSKKIWQASKEWDREREHASERRERGPKLLSARNRIREWFMGLRRGRIHGVRPAFFIFLRPFLSFLRAHGYPAAPWGLAVCAEFESPCNKIRALCDGPGTPRGLARPRAFTYEKVKCIQVRSAYTAVSLIRYKAPVTTARPTASRTADVNNTSKLLPASVHHLSNPPLTLPLSLAQP